MTSIILPYRPEIFEGMELLYALRSIEKNLSGFDNLIIIGQPPDWFKGEWVSAQNYPGRKQYTIYQKLLIACELNNCSDNFIMWNDDHFLLQPLSVNDFKYWHNGTLKDELARPNIYARYYNAVKKTLDFIPDGINFDIHVPIVYNKDQFRKLFCNKQNEICVKRYYCNAIGLQGECMDDLKIDKLLSEEAIKELIKDRLFLSTTSNAMRAPMIKVLGEMFPFRSRWE
jgi:hypothetical protein